MKTRFILGSALAAVLLMWGGTGKVMAQKNIDKMAAELEKRDDVAINSVTKRDPKTRKVVKVVKSFSLKDENIGARLIEAFEKDEEYAETAIKDMPKGRGKAQKANFTFIYKTDNEKRTYTLNVKESGSVSMTVIISPMKDGQEVGSVVLDPEYWEAFEKDEEYAETAIKDMPKGRGKAQKANFTFIYKTDNEKRTYTLNVKESGSVSMTVIISPMKDGQEVGSVVLDPEYWDSFNEQMAELGNNLRDSGIEVRQMSREEMEKMQETIRQSLKGLDAYAIAE